MSRTAVLVPLTLLAVSAAAGHSSAAPTREPTLIVPADMTVEAQSPTGAAVPFTVSATGRENQSLPVTCSPASGASFPLGQTTVTCTAQDRPDEIVTRSFRITVIDRTAPRLVVPASVKARTANRKGAVVRFRVSATDLVDTAILPVCSPASSTLFRVGVTRVDCTATDRGQNVARASFTVSVKLVRKTRQVGRFSPGAGQVVSTAPLLSWPRTPRATYYNVQIFRGGHQILSAWPSRPRFQLRDAWTHHGQRMLLSPGTYVWFVWPGFGDLARAQYGALLGRSTFRVQ
jgi:HYR domain